MARALPLPHAHRRFHPRPRLHLLPLLRPRLHLLRPRLPSWLPRRPPAPSSLPVAPPSRGRSSVAPAVASFSPNVLPRWILLLLFSRHPLLLLRLLLPLSACAGRVGFGLLFVYLIYLSDFRRTFCVSHRRVAARSAGRLGEHGGTDAWGSGSARVSVWLWACFLFGLYSGVYILAALALTPF